MIESEFALFSIVIVISLGIFSQWLAWRIQWPSIVIMSIAGLLIGPITGFINPQEAIGSLYSPIISLAVALILFEGSTSLDIRELKGISKSVYRIVTFGAFLAWIGGALAAHFIAGLNLEISFIIGGLFVVTGPTVIIPLLRQAKLKTRVSSVLKWEGIIVDPIGPLLALFAYEIIKITSAESFEFADFIPFFGAALLAVMVGYIIGILVSLLIGKGIIPEYLKSPFILCFVLICFSIGEVIMHETGMLAVTIMGVTLARTKKYIRSIGSIGHFMEDVSVLLTSTVFILLTASLTRDILTETFTWPIISFVVVMLFLVRPLSIWISTIGTELTLKEKALVGWIAPRGIVALAVSGYFAEVLIADGYQNASILTSLTFALVFITVCVHGFSIGPLSKRLGLANTRSNGVLMVGASSFSIALAAHLETLEIKALIADTSEDRLYKAKKLGISTYHGEILSEQSDFEIDMTPYQTILAMKGDGAYNALICQSYLPTFGYHHTFSLMIAKNTLELQELSPSMKANMLFGEKETFTELNKKVNIGYTFKTIEITDKRTLDKNARSAEGTPLCVKSRNGKLNFVTLQKKVTLDKGDQLVVLVA
ncbi:sodium:proton antiporter [Gracilibacillus caseinilyticus]|uniref:Sodium:proton antiporter n=1 Tax=Gracilibacillus caseinilyticus TaxID=2932256 RepID=A0ABY4F2F7_9BACI|nr:sodium:proton antiporter [Gracilibacillus caseinilyticus]UOQ50674.1 sodium:proton antiporter [Gracilibacillus caseinilyticus]